MPPSEIQISGVKPPVAPPGKGGIEPQPPESDREVGHSPGVQVELVPPGVAVSIGMEWVEPRPVMAFDGGRSSHPAIADRLHRQDRGLDRRNIDGRDGGGGERARHDKDQQNWHSGRSDEHHNLRQESFNRERYNLRPSCGRGLPLVNDRLPWAVAARHRRPRFGPVVRPGSLPHYGRGRPGLDRISTDRFWTELPEPGRSVRARCVKGSPEWAHCGTALPGKARPGWVRPGTTMAPPGIRRSPMWGNPRAWTGTPSVQRRPTET